MKTEIQLTIPFPDYVIPTREERQAEKARRDWQTLRSKNFGTEYCSRAMRCGKYGMPQLPIYTGQLPKRFVTFSELSRTADLANCCVTCFDADYLIERLWQVPGRYAARFAACMCFAEPDFSLRVDDPLAVQIANTYRSRAVSCYMVEHNARLLPSVSWAGPQSYEFCFDGHGRGGAVLVSTIGTRRDERSQIYFRRGFDEMLRRLSPEAVVLYGDVDEPLLASMPRQLNVLHVPHARFARARQAGKSI